MVLIRAVRLKGFGCLCLTGAGMPQGSKLGNEGKQIAERTPAVMTHSHLVEV